MTINDLTAAQRFELKQRYLSDYGTEDPSYEDLINADKLVSNTQLTQAYTGINFVEDDFLSQ